MIPDFHDAVGSRGDVAPCAGLGQALAAGLRRLIVSTYQAASGAGLAGTAELETQLVKTVDGAAALTFDGHAVDYPAPTVFPDVIAHNVVAVAGSPIADDSGDTTEERKFREESRKILEIADLDVGLLFILAVSSLGIYGIVLGGGSDGPDPFARLQDTAAEVLVMPAAPYAPPL